MISTSSKVAADRMDDQRRRTTRSAVLWWTLTLLIFSVLALFLLGPRLQNPAIDGVLSYWHERYMPVTIVGFICAYGLVFRWYWRDFRETGDPWILVRLSAYLVLAIVPLVFLSWKSILSTAGPQ
jgi:cell division protein FtsW (lipid II flippase)